MLKKGWVEKILNGYLQAIAYFFNRRNRGAIITTADDIIQGGLSNATYRG